MPLAFIMLFVLPHSSPIESLFHILSCDIWVLTQNQDEDIRSPHSTQVDLFWTL